MHLQRIHTPFGVPGIEILGFEVFNRWGQKVFATSDRTLAVEGWNGTFKGQKQPSDVYIYVFEYREPGQLDSTVIRGHSTLLR